MTSWERLYALYKSIQYVVENKIPGGIVECGGCRSGSMKLVAQVLRALGETDRTLFLYGTFEGMTEPDPALDVVASGNKASNDWLEIQRRGVKWSYASVEEVREVVAVSGHPMDKVVFVKRPVEDTIPATLPDMTGYPYCVSIPIGMLRPSTRSSIYTHVSQCRESCCSMITGTTREHSGRLTNILIELEDVHSLFASTIPAGPQ